MGSLNLSLIPGYPSRSSETGGLHRDQFVKHSKSHAKWYGLHPNKASPASSVSFWHCDSAKLNSAYSWMTRSSGLTSPAPTSHFMWTLSDVGRRQLGSPPMFLIKQPDSVGALLRSSKVCSLSSKFYSQNKPK